ncbi:MAG: hypothetical protein AB7N76_00305 [Planctomycetota bacterium]
MAFDPVRFKQKLIYEAKARPEVILSELRQVEAYDRAAEQRVSTFNIVFPIVAFAVFLVVLFVVMSMARHKDPGACFCVGMGVFFPAMIVFGIVQSQLQRHDLEDARYQLLRRLLKVLAADMAPEDPVAVRLDMEPVHAEHKQAQPNGGRGRYTIRYSKDPWLSLTGRFVDGTRFRVRVTQLTESRLHAKGQKSKEKVQLLVDLQLRPKAKRYAHLETIGADARRAVQLPVGAALKGCQVTAGEVALRAGVKHKSFNGELTAGQKVDLAECVSLLFLSAYQVLNLSRRLTRRGVTPGATRQGGAGSGGAAPTGRLVGGPAGAPISAPEAAGRSAAAAPPPPPAGPAAPPAGPATLPPLAMFENLVLAAAADRTLDPSERELLSQHAARLGIDQATVRSTCEQVSSGQLQAFRIPTDPAACLAAFQAIAEVMRADGRVGGRETHVLRTLAAKMKIPAAEVARALKPR